MCVHNENCAFMRTYMQCYIESEGKVPLTKDNSKTRLNKSKTTFSRCTSYHFVYLYFSTTVRQALPYKTKEVYISEHYS